MRPSPTAAAVAEPEGDQVGPALGRAAEVGADLAPRLPIELPHRKVDTKIVLICPNKAEISKVDYSSKVNSCTVHYFAPPIGTVVSLSILGAGQGANTKIGYDRV